MQNGFGWHYKGTKIKIKVDDLVTISAKIAKDNKVTRDAVVTGLHGFITVRMSNGELMDLDARQVSQRV